MSIPGLRDLLAKLKPEAAAGLPEGDDLTMTMTQKLVSFRRPNSTNRCFECRQITQPWV